MRAGFVSLIGPPNAGKSTLMNTLVGQKVSIVTHKVQTTRSRIRGIAMHNDAQVVFIDTPGIFAPRRRPSGYETGSCTEPYMSEEDGNDSACGEDG